MIMPTYTENDTPCPWHINFRKSDVYFYWKKHFNHWNPNGNGWKLENKIDVRCYDESESPAFGCGCSKVNVTSVKGRISEYHPKTLGVYTYVQDSLKMGFLAPVFKKEDGVPHYLYSHHPNGHLWLVGTSLTSWSLRLNMLDYDFDSDEFQEFTQGIWRFNNICPIRKAPNTVWEYLQQRNGEDEIWLKDDIFSVQCIE